MRNHIPVSVITPTAPTATEYFAHIISNDLGLQCKYVFSRPVGNRLYSKITDEYLEYCPEFLGHKVGKRNRKCTDIIGNILLP